MSVSAPSHSLALTRGSISSTERAQSRRRPTGAGLLRVRHSRPAHPRRPPGCAALSKVSINCSSRRTRSSSLSRGGPNASPKDGISALKTAQYPAGRAVYCAPTRRR